MTSTYTYLLVVVLREPQECIKVETEQEELHLIVNRDTMMSNKAFIILCVVIVGAAWIEATDEHPTLKESLVIAERPPVYPKPVSHLTSEKSTTLLPSSTTENDLPHQLTESLHKMEYLVYEEINLSEATTTESGISKKGSSPATQSDEEFILEEITLSPVKSNKDKTTSQQTKASIKSMMNSIILIGSITIVILILVLIVVLVENFCVWKTTKLDRSRFDQHSNMVYQTTIEVDNISSKPMK